MKTCTKCGVEKELIAFARNCSSPDDRRSTCKTCHGKVVRAWTEKHKDEHRAYHKQFAKDNRAYYNNYEKQRNDNDPSYKLSRLLRGRFNKAVKNKAKKGSAVRDLGCSILGFKLYIENQFEDGMTWENHGKVWELDHVVPLCCYDLTDFMEVQEACNWLNIQPLRKEENHAKNRFFDGY